jgi:ubiquinone/menaquinone biosynthesis C-methylase UbiE
MDDYNKAKLYDKILFPFLYPIRRRILKLIKTKGYKKILDVCCGTGNQLKILKKHGIVGEGIDLSENMLSVALKGKNSVNCKLEDATGISYPDENFDLVMTTFALHEKEPEIAKKIFREMIRLIKNDGEIIIVDFNISPEVTKFSAAIINYIESRAGDEHYANFCKYKELGGLDYLLQGYNFKKIKRETIFSTGVSIVILTK